MTATRTQLELDRERLNFLDDCRAKLALIERGLAPDPTGDRAAELAALIARHEHVSWLDEDTPRGGGRRRPPPPGSV